jgi:hypothetical protein
MQQKMLHQINLLSLFPKTLGQFNQRFGQILQQTFVMIVLID